MFIVLAPQNITGYSVLPYMKEMGEAAGERPIVLINPRLVDIPSANNGGRRLQGAANGPFASATPAPPAISVSHAGAWLKPPQPPPAHCSSPPPFPPFSAPAVMQVRGREDRLAFVDSYEEVYHFRLLYRKPFAFPIYGALRYSFGAEPPTASISTRRAQRGHFRVTRLRLGASRVLSRGERVGGVQAAGEDAIRGLPLLDSLSDGAPG